ncbi:MAG: hypothetical protein KME40_34580 [Komarekiella atlantica HA4396-MV6]|nr:hypothetical protein [Komarekiella atlantica HA4396-MV6]
MSKCLKSSGFSWLRGMGTGEWGAEGRRKITIDPCTDAITCTDAINRVSTLDKG